MVEPRRNFPYLLKNSATATVNGNTYFNMITFFLYPHLMVLMWTMFGFSRKLQMPYSNYCAKHLVTVESAELVKSLIPSGHFTPFNFFLWRAVKDMCYAKIQRQLIIWRPAPPSTRKSAKKLVKPNRLLWCQPRHPFEWNNVLFTSGIIVL